MKNWIINILYSIILRLDPEAICPSLEVKKAYDKHGDFHDRLSISVMPSYTVLGNKKVLFNNDCTFIHAGGDIKRLKSHKEAVHYLNNIL